LIGTGTKDYFSIRFHFFTRFFRGRLSDRRAASDSIQKILIEN
jgi:hypothetical protein